MYSTVERLPNVYYHIRTLGVCIRHIGQFPFCYHIPQSPLYSTAFCYVGNG